MEFLPVENHAVVEDFRKLHYCVERVRRHVVNRGGHFALLIEPLELLRRVEDSLGSNQGWVAKQTKGKV